MHPILFLDYDGCLHPDDVYCVNGEPVFRTQGAQLFEHAELLAELLEPYPQLKIVLSTSWVRVFDFNRAKGYLPTTLQNRVIGTTYEFCDDAGEWFELSKFDQIMRYVQGHQIQSWLALDDDNNCWPEIFENNLICPYRRIGLGESRVRVELATKLEQLHQNVQ
ncbi:HAD domain-containing protein [Crenobacter cavernae]|uniref:FCP1 homology domain-containing protein n=1 Tax=Crenobacter cavernae TaxID=2290923 RepID=A0A345Y3K3_9NEIS|nr:HAD domain-containing protein [Crenobacter cavernae]AXK38505.1 hypothetical protein DWG20_03170 [Crenobacter cavernae]